jgi:hypothetical protein
MNPVEVLREGAAELASILGPDGFAFAETGSGSSSGGLYASGEFRRDNRRLELHVRWSLGMVTYHVDDATLRHEDLTRAVAATQHLGESAQYPGFSDQPLDGFRHLAADLVKFGRVFTRGTAEEFSVLVAWIQRHPRPKGLAALP